MKTFALCLTLFLPFVIFAQTQTGKSAPEFDGVKVDSTLNYCVSQFVKKGFTITDETRKASRALKGMLGTDEVEVILVATPLTNKVWKASVYFAKQDSWSSIKDKFNSLRDLLLKKYGEADEDFHFFSDPYKEGDGDEMTAISEEKCNYFSYWKKNLMNKVISIEISKYKQVNVAYENSVNAELNKNERDKATSDGL